MNIISCDNCGVLLDKSKIKIPEVGYDQEYSTSDFKWDGEQWCPLVTCPVCENLIIFIGDN